MSRRARRFVVVACFALLAALGIAAAQTDQVEDNTPRFTSVEIHVDPRGQSMAAYQVEFVADPARVTLVGIEGGQHPAFVEPPYYDPKALSGNRVIVAALNTGNDLPVARTRVATLHLRVLGAGEPNYSAKLHVAGDPQGKPIPADVTVSEGVRR